MPYRFKVFIIKLFLQVLAIASLSGCSDGFLKNSFEFKNTLSVELLGTTSNSSYVRGENFTLEGGCNKIGARVALYGSDDSLLGDTLCDKNFRFSFPVFIDVSNLAEESVLLFHAVLTDPDRDNVTTESKVLRLIYARGVLLISVNTPSGSNITSLNQAAVQVTGSCDAVDATVSFSHTTSTAICDGTGYTATLDFRTVPTEGQIPFQAFIEGSNGAGGSSDVLNLNKDTIVPLISINTPSNGFVINASSPIAAIPVSGTCDELGLISFSSGAGSINCDGANFSGTLNFSSESEGVLNLQATLTDAVGNAGSSNTVSVTKDTGVPVIAIANPVNNFIINASSPVSAISVSGTCNQVGSISFSVGAGSINCDGANFTGTLNFSAVADGALSLQASLSDAAGNTGTSNEVSITKDVEVPLIEITSIPPGNTINFADKASISIGGTCSEAGQQVSFSHGVGTANCDGINFSTTLNFNNVDDGNVPLTATISDLANNSTTSTVVNLDKLAPQPPVIISPAAADSLLYSTLDVTGTCLSGLTVRLVSGVDGAPLTTSCDGANNFAFNDVVLSNSPGAQSIVANQFDSFGSTSSNAIRNFSYDAFALSIASPAGAQVNMALVTVGDVPFDILWGDGATATSVPSGTSRVNYFYPAAFSGFVIFEGIARNQVEEISSGRGFWDFDLSDLPNGVLTSIDLTGGNDTNHSVSGNLSSLMPPLANLNLGGSNTVTGDVSNLPSNLDSLSLQGLNTVTGDIQNLPANLTSATIHGRNTVFGDVSNFPANFTRMSILGDNTISGDLTDFSATITNIDIQGDNTISGDVANFKPGLTSIRLSGHNTVTGDMSSIHPNFESFRITGENTIFGSLLSLAGASSLETFQVIGNNTITGSLSDIPNLTTNIDIRGNNSISGNLSDLHSSVTHLTIQGANTITGDYADLPNTIEDLWLFNSTTFGDIANFDGARQVIIQGANPTVSGDLSGLTSISILIIQAENNVTGDIADVPSNCRSFDLRGSNTVTGSIANISATGTLRLHGNNTVFGNIADIPLSIGNFEVSGANTISGVLEDLPANVGALNLEGDNTVGVSSSVWNGVTPNSMNYVLLGGSKVRPSSEIDAILELLATVPLWRGTTTRVDLRGANSAAPSAAAGPFITTIEANGADVRTN